jgi:hypothetical protein
MKRTLSILKPIDDDLTQYIGPATIYAKSAYDADLIYQIYDDMRTDCEVVGIVRNEVNFHIRKNLRRLRNKR